MSSTVKPIQRTRNETVVQDATLTGDADVILASGGTVRLGPGFHAEEGSKLRVYTDPAISEPPTFAQRHVFARGAGFGRKR